MSGLTDRFKTLAKLNVVALGILHLSNRYINSVSAGKNLLKPGNGKYYRWKYGEVFYHKSGSGSPLVLLHDLSPTSSSYEWSEVTDILSEQYTVYTVDLPGCGRSTKDNTTYTNYYYVLFLTSFLKDVVKKKCRILASGYTSSFAIMAASQENSLIEEVTAVNPKSLKELLQTTTKKSRAAGILLSLPVIGTTIYNILVSHTNIDLAFTEGYMFNPFRSKNRFVDAYYEGAHFNEERGKYLLASIEGKYMTVNLSQAVQKMGERLTILYGDKTNGEQIAAGYQKVNPSIKALAVSKTRQLPQLERPQEFVNVFNAIIRL